MNGWNAESLMNLVIVRIIDWLMLECNYTEVKILWKNSLKILSMIVSVLCLISMVTMHRRNPLEDHASDTDSNEYLVIIKQVSPLCHNNGNKTSTTEERRSTLHFEGRSWAA